MERADTVWTHTGRSGFRGTDAAAMLAAAGVPAQLETVLAHEIRHVGRRDNLTAALHMVVEALFWVRAGCRADSCRAAGIVCQVILSIRGSQVAAIRD